MKVTSAQAAKLLKKLNEEYSALIKKERLSSTFLAASGEDPESLRPAYDYADTQRKLAEIEKKVRTVRHALNLFNSTHTVPGFDMTVDQILVYIPQLTSKISKLSEMKSKLPKMRVDDRYGKSSNIIEDACKQSRIGWRKFKQLREKKSLCGSIMLLHLFHVTLVEDADMGATLVDHHQT